MNERNRSDAMEWLVEQGVDVEDAAVVSGAATIWVETPTGATLRPAIVTASATVRENTSREGKQ